MSEPKKYRQGDTCPSCGDAKLEFDNGQRESSSEPELPPACHCPNCGDEFEVDYVRQAKFEIATMIANDLFTDGFGNRADRLLLHVEAMKHWSTKPGWCFGAVVDRVVAILDQQV